MNNQTFDIPVAMFLFRRKEKSVKIIQRLSEIRPTTLYLIADGGRNEAEQVEVEKTRAAVEVAINWECNIIRNYSDENRGVYNNIGGGAKWVFSKEKYAIFIEDDNLPELSFFDYCKELLLKYENNERILWICGTNYLGRYDHPYSYMFTQNLLPCGWASWSEKFLKYYDGNLSTFSPEYDRKLLRSRYHNKALFTQDYNNFCFEKSRTIEGKRFTSWDYQMAYTIRKYNLLGISPCCNQIKNIGVDSDSIHGGTSLSSIMTSRLCGMESYPLDFPLKHPNSVNIDDRYSRMISRIILVPLKIRARNNVLKLMHKLLHLKPDEHLKDKLRIRRK